MSNSRKKFPAGPICTTGPHEGRIMKRFKAKRERAFIRQALVHLEDPPAFQITPTSTWDIGDGKTHYLNANPDRIRKLMRK